MLSGEYGEKDIAMGVSCLLNRQGMERTVDPGLNDGEMRMPRESAASVCADIARMKPPK